MAKSKLKSTILQPLSCAGRAVGESSTPTVSVNIKKYAKKYSKISDLNSTSNNKELSLNNRKNS